MQRSLRAVQHAEVRKLQIPMSARYVEWNRTKQGVCVPCREAIGKDVDSNFQSLMAAYLLDAMPLLEIVMEHMEGYDENFIQHIGA